MLQRILTSATLFLILLALLMPSGRVQAIPQLPSSVYGTVQLNNAPVPDGTLIQAIIGGQVVAYRGSQTYQGNSVYGLDIPSDNPETALVDGGKEGDTIQFKIGGILAAQTGTWHSATNVEINLSAISVNTPLPPQPTVTPLPTQTFLPAVQPTATVFVPSPTAPLPTEGPTLYTATPGTTLPAASNPAAASTVMPSIFPTSTALMETTPAEEPSPRRQAQNIALGIVILAALVGVVMMVRGRASKK